MGQNTQPRQPGEKFKEPQSSFGYLRRQKWTDAIAALATRLKTGQATSASVVTAVTSFSAQPDKPRTITVTPGGTTADVPAGDVTIVGTNIRNEAITDVVTFAANASTVGETTKAFKTVTSVTFPVQDGAAATYDIGVGDKLGLDRCMQGNEVLRATIDGVIEGTLPTVTFHATDVSKNTIDTNTAYNGSRDVVALYVSTERTSNNGTTV